MFLFTVLYSLITWNKREKKEEKILHLIVKYLWWYFPLQQSFLAVHSLWPLANLNCKIMLRLIVDLVFIRLKTWWERLVLQIWSLRKLIKHPVPSPKKKRKRRKKSPSFFLYLKNVWTANCLYGGERVLCGSFGSLWYVSLLSAEPTSDALLAEKSILESQSIFLFWEAPQNRKRDDVRSPSPGCSPRPPCISLLPPLGPPHRSPCMGRPAEKTGKHDLF